MIFNMTGGGSGSGATLVVSCPANVTVTVSKDDKSYTKNSGNLGSATFKGLATGEWTVTIEGNEQTATRTITITADYAITMAFFAAYINITYPANSTCVVQTSGGVTVASDSNTDSSSKTWTATVNATGTYKITATATDGSGKSKSTTVSITTDDQSKSIPVTLNYRTYYYNKGDTYDSVTGGWVKTGSGTLTFNSESMTLVANTYQAGANAATANMVELTDIKTLYFSVKSATTYPKPGYPRVGISKNNNPSSGGSNLTKWAASSGLSASDSFQTVSVDISSCTAGGNQNGESSYYIAFGGYNGDSGGATIEVEAIWSDDI